MRSLLFLLVFTVPLLAAPVPMADEKPKPRAKLLGTLVVTAPVQSVFWTPDGKHLVLVTDRRVQVYPRDQIGAEKPKPLTAFDRPDANGEVRPTTDGGLWVLAPAGQKVNAENRLHFWSAKTLIGGGEPKADKVLDLEADNPHGLLPASDGGLYATLMSTRRANGFRDGYEYLPTFLRLSAKTGDVLKRVALADLSEGRYTGSVFDPRTGRLFLAVLVGDETEVSCRDLDGGKPLWARKLGAKPDADSHGAFVLSPDGSRIAYRQPTLTAVSPGNGGGGWGGAGPGGGFPPRGGGGAGGGRPQPVEYTSTSTLLTFDAKTGELGAELAKADIRSGRGYSFSADGRLLFASVGTAEGGKLGVWEAKTGAELKVWARGSADVDGAFAPSGFELAIVERERREATFPQLARPDLLDKVDEEIYMTQGNVVRVRYTSTVGIWDLSPVVK